jgi:hypothetical protein
LGSAYNEMMSGEPASSDAWAVVRQRGATHWNISSKSV